MYAVERFIQGAILIIVLTFIGALNTDTIFKCLFLSGVLLCIICERSFTEERKGITILVQFLLSIAFVFVTDSYTTYLVFFLISDKMIFLPSVFCVVCQMIIKREDMPVIICQALILAVVSAIIYAICHFAEKYIAARGQVSRAVSDTAVNEMYAK